MSSEARDFWDRRHAQSLPAPVIQPPPPPPVFAHVEHHFPREGRVLDLACGRGEGAVWLAGRGMDYRGVDISPVAIDMAGKLVAAYGLEDRCLLEVWDLDRGLPSGKPVDLLFCHLFREPDLYEAMLERLAPNGLLAVAVLSETTGEKGRFRARRGELREAFGHLDVLDEGESGGVARLVARKN